MSTPTIQVLGISAGDESVSSNEKKVNLQSRLRLHGRVTVPNQDGSFDTVRIRLQGVIHTKIGSQGAIAKTAIASVTKTNFDFKPVYSVTRQTTEQQYLDFECAVPTSKSGGSESFIPSMTLTGRTYLTKVTALTNRELLNGSCEVAYTLEADFLRSETNQLVRRISCPVDISSSLAPLDVQATSVGQSGKVEEIAKPQLRSWSRFRGTSSQPGLSVEMPKTLGSIISDFSTVSTGCRRFTMPIAVNASLPSDLRRKAQALSEKDQLRCTVKAKWFADRTFTTGSSAVESTVHSDSVSSQTYTLALPPFYQSSPASSKYTTMLELDLLLPESMAMPSISTALLNVSYRLELTMNFEASSNEVFKGPYTTSFVLPVALRASRQNSMISRHGHDVHLGVFAEQSLVAPPPYVC